MLHQVFRNLVCCRSDLRRVPMFLAGWWKQQWDVYMCHEYDRLRRWPMYVWVRIGVHSQLGELRVGASWEFHISRGGLRSGRGLCSPSVRRPSSVRRTQPSTRSQTSISEENTTLYQIADLHQWGEHNPLPDRRPPSVGRTQPSTR